MSTSKADTIIEKARLRFEELREIIANAEAVKGEYYQLDGFLRQAYQLFPDAFPEPPVLIGSVTPSTPAPQAFATPIGGTIQSKAPGAPATKDAAASVLRMYGRLHIREVLKRMRDVGWIGNTDDKKAKKTLFNTMASRKNYFVNVGNNYWELREAGKRNEEKKADR